jgi:hypothetical protein
MCDKILLYNNNMKSKYLTTQEEFRQNIDEITELDTTPYNVEEYLNNNKYHSFLKGCECEMRVVKGYASNVILNKYCKTHDKLCSKTGWELGWYKGTKTEKHKDSFGEIPHDIIRQIRADSNNGINKKELAKKHNLSYNSILNIVNYNSYRYVE